jgi:hypothetical protein
MRRGSEGRKQIVGVGLEKACSCLRVGYQICYTNAMISFMLEQGCVYLASGKRSVDY